MTIQKINVGPAQAAAGRQGKSRLWRSLGLTLLSGLLLCGAQPSLDWGWLAWVALLPFLSLFPFRSGRAAFGHGVLLGVFSLGVMSSWVFVFARPLIGPGLSALGWALLTLCEAFFVGAWALGAQKLKGRRSLRGAASGPGGWAFRPGGR